MTLRDIADSVGGRLSADADPRAEVTGSVEHDSRKITTGGLFVAFAGEHVDGHDFARSAVSQGAVGVLAARDIGAPAIVVDDVQAALGLLARTVIDRLDDLTVIALTGSSGKTSTKDFLGRVCAELGPVVAPEGNLNNELGLPYTVCKADASTRYLVLEMGARGTGHIAYLCDIAPVDVGIVLNVGPAHIGEFGSVEAITAAKGELAAAVPPNGVVILNGDDSAVASMRARARARVVTFGTGPDADVSADNIVMDRGRAHYRLSTSSGSSEVALRLYGAHQVSNTLAAAAAATELGMTPAQFARVASSPVTVSARRMDVFAREDGVTVIDDSYNANPASMAAAVAALTEIGANGRTIAVLGFMAELGDTTDTAHRELGKLTADSGIDVVIAVEPEAYLIARAADNNTDPPLTRTVATQAEAIDMLDTLITPSDTILVKASRYRTWKIADHLRGGQATVKEAQA